MVIVAAMLFTLPVSAQNNFAKKAKVGPKEILPANRINPRQAEKVMILKLKAQKANDLTNMVELKRAETKRVVEELTQRVLEVKPDNTRSLLSNPDLIVKNAPVKRNAILRAEGEVVDANGIITSPAEGTEKHYTRSGVGLEWNDALSAYDEVEAAGDLTIVECEDGTVYIKDILSQFKAGTYVKGTKDGNVITVPTGQNIYYNSSYGIVYFMGWGIPDGTGDYSLESESDTFTFAIDGDVISLENSSVDYIMANFYTYNGSTYCGTGEYNSVWTYNADWEPLVVNDELVALPEGVTAETWHAAGADKSGSNFKRDVQVAFNGNDVYVCGVFSDFPDAWMKGTLEGTTITFAGLQFVGTYSSYSMYAVGTANDDLVNFTMTYDADARVMTADMSLLLNAATDRIYYLAWYDDLLIQAESFPEGTAVTGEPVDALPYTNGFDTADDFAQFGVIDANEDGKTWTLADGDVAYSYNGSADGDDWLISPAIKLEAGKLYHFAIDAKAGLANYPERFEVMMGTQAKASFLTKQVIAPTDVSSNVYATFENEDLTVEEDGYYHFAIHCISDADQYKLYVDNFLVEEGAAATGPAAVFNFLVTPFDDGTIGATITFNAPTKKINGTDLTENLTKIDVLRDGNVIATLNDVEPGAGCNYVDDASDLTLGNHSYQVIPYDAEGPGQKSDVITVRLTGVLDLPYFVDFSVNGAVDAYSVIDANNDGKTWGFYNGAVSYLYSSENAADDYLVSSGFNMKAGKHYHMVINANGSGWDERFEVLLGKETTVEGLNTTIMEPVVVSSSDPADFTCDFDVEEDGVYYFAIHAISDPDMFRLYVHTITIDALSGTSPAAITDLSVEPGAEGALNATLTFTAPAKNLDGDDLTENIAKVEIIRNGEVIETLTDVAPGTPVTYTDESIPEAGDYGYEVAARDADNGGMKSEKVTVYVGPDAMGNIKNFVVASSTPSTITFTWDEIAGANGGYIDAANAEYSIYSLAIEEDPYWGSYLVADEKLTTVTGETTATIDFPVDEGEQGYQYFGISAKLPETEESDPTNAYLGYIVGAPYELPVEEGFADNSLHYNWSWNGSLYVTQEATDGDGVAVQMLTFNGNETLYFQLDRVNLNGAANPVLMFDVKSSNMSSIRVYGAADGAEPTVLSTVEIGSEYTTVCVPLTGLAGERFTTVGFEADFVEPSEEDLWTGEILTLGDEVTFDHILIYDQLEDNLVIDLSAPRSVVAGKTVPVTISVKNMGANVAEDYAVKLTAGNEEIEINEDIEAIEPMQTVTYTADFAPSIFTEAGDVTLRAEAVYEYDLADEDNVYEAIITVNQPTVPAPLSLTAVANGSKAELEWTVAEVGEPTEQTESFEDTEAFPAWGLGGITADNQTGAFGDWTVYDGNNMGVYSFQGINVPNMGPDYPAAWQVINSEAGAEFYESFPTSYPAVTGQQFLWSICPVDDSHAPEADHWLISPELPGIAQTISLQAKQISTTDGTAEGYYGLETFEVLASSTDSEIESFEKVGDNQITSEDWAGFTADLPEGTKFFAIRHNSTDIFGLLIDDIVYFAAGGATATGFNIYVDEVLVGAVEGGVLTYVTNELPIGEHKVSVTALYGSNESLPVDAIVVIEVPTAIEEVINAEGLMNIFNLNGVKVQGETKHLQKGTYIINNKKVVVK